MFTLDFMKLTINQQWKYTFKMSASLAIKDNCASPIFGKFMLFSELLLIFILNMGCISYPDQ